VKEPSFKITKLGNGSISVLVEGEEHPFLFSDMKHLPHAIMLKEVKAAVTVIKGQRELKELAATLEQANEILSDMTEATDSSPPPPVIAEAMISLFTPKHFADAQLGDMQEIFVANAQRFGLRRAKRLYWYEVARSVGPIFFHWLKRVGFIAVLVDYGRKKMGL
jgi:hypothetical protein